MNYEYDTWTNPLKYNYTTTTAPPSSSTTVTVPFIDNLQEQIDKLKEQYDGLNKASADCSSAIVNLWKQFNSDRNYSWTGNMVAPREKEEKMNMPASKNNLMPNFNFGPCGDRAKISPLGIAVQNTSGEWVSYDKDSGEIVNVDLLNFGSNNFVYMIPVALKDVAEGDAVIHNKHIMFVNKVRDNGLSVIDVTDGEYKKILPTKSVFGFNFITKVVSLIDFSASTASEDNPFGNMLPFLLLGDNMKGNDALPLALMMSNGNLSGGSEMSSSMLTIAMLISMGKTGTSMSEVLPLMMLMNPTLFSKIS